MHLLPIPFCQIAAPPDCRSPFAASDAAALGLAGSDTALSYHWQYWSADRCLDTAGIIPGYCVTLWLCHTIGNVCLVPGYCLAGRGYVANCCKKPSSSKSLLLPRSAVKLVSCPAPLLRDHLHMYNITNILFLSRPTEGPWGWGYLNGGTTSKCMLMDCIFCRFNLVIQPPLKKLFPPPFEMFWV